ncbi:four helix bundle protein [Mucilaginibacter sp. BJC16-A38]|uniref:four helix bundle protein n=1 Tax=Mucilaginibacter phenanthrenivorans TaxID=1234842 RepID=UPI00215785A0|nr:four helix bundle protein [Mucilaginibacter phenanthrenivorans]MCR8560516.1 four helix bundle protein [Mucilaginibacter phenanthrenivorans]
MEKRYLQLSDLNSYKTAFYFSNKVWDIVIKWDYFAKDTVGKQFVTAADSISANIAEGFGRYHKKDKVKFYYYSLGSTKECTDWLSKAKTRNLIPEELFSELNEIIERLPREIHQLIKFTNEKLTV